MSPSSYFLLSFAGPVIGGAALAFLAWSTRIWMAEHSMPYMIIIFLAFIGGWMFTRWLVHSFVAVHCPKCNKGTAYEMEGIACRFRCRVCFKEF